MFAHIKSCDFLSCASLLQPSLQGIYRESAIIDNFVEFRHKILLLLIDVVVAAESHVISIARKSQVKPPCQTV